LPRAPRPQLGGITVNSGKFDWKASGHYVNRQRKAVPMGDFRNCVDVGNIAVRVAEGFQINRAGVALNGVLNLGEVVRIHERRGDTEMRQGKARGNYPAIADPNPSYHGVSFADAVGPAAFVTYIRAILLRDTGATISPFNAFLLLQGVETLSLRLERHAENTKKVVAYLAHHPQVEHVNHPSLPEHPDHALYEKYFPNGGASIFTFNIKGGQKEAHKFIDSLKIFSLLANVADVKSLVIHPATTTHSQLTDEELADQGIAQNTIRLSIGTEHIDDIIADLEQAFEAVKAAE